MILLGRYVFYSTIAKWLKRFRQGRASLEDITRIGRLVAEVADENIDDVRVLIEENPHISIRYIAWKFFMSYGTVNSIIHGELKMKRLHARWVPHQLREERKKLLMEI